MTSPPIRLIRVMRTPAMASACRERSSAMPNREDLETLYNLYCRDFLHYLLGASPLADLAREKFRTLAGCDRVCRDARGRPEYC